MILNVYKIINELVSECFSEIIKSCVHNSYKDKMKRANLLNKNVNSRKEYYKINVHKTYLDYKLH